jgi:hypothetical protein
MSSQEKITVTNSPAEETRSGQMSLEHHSGRRIDAVQFATPDCNSLNR